MSVTQTFDVEDLETLIEREEAPVLLDVRSPAEYETAHIPGSHNVPLDALGEHREELANGLDSDVVLICRSGQRAGRAERRFAEVGMSKTHVLDGGIMAWEKAGRDVNRGRERWDIERQVRVVAGSIVLGSILVSIVVPVLKWLAAAIGAGLAIAALTNTCMMGNLLSRLPYNRTDARDTSEVVAELTSSADAA